MDVEVLAIDPAAGAQPEEPRVVSREGERERDPPAEAPALTGRARAALDAARLTWNPDPDPEEPTPGAGIDPARAGEALEAIVEAFPSADALRAMAGAEGLDVASLLRSAVEAAAAGGDPAVALRVAERFAAMTHLPDLLVAAGRAFLVGHRDADALRAAEVVERFDGPLTQESRLAAAMIRVGAGDLAGGEARLRRLVDHRWPSPRVRTEAVGLLAEVLRMTGRGEEAGALELGERRRGVQEAGVVRRAAPKVGRNDPCPCGSGKKAKKCCGA